MKRSEQNGRRLIKTAPQLNPKTHSKVRFVAFRYDLQLTLLDPAIEKHPMPCSCHMTKCIVLRTYLEQFPDGKEPVGEAQACSSDSDAEIEDGLEA
jgi:hypothetical protein